jgi:imidazolonepropionase
MPVLKNINYLATCKDNGSQNDIHSIHNAAIVWQNEVIRWVGKERNLPGKYAGEKSYDAEGRMAIPGLIDCHTHLAFGGWRPKEFALRVQGKSYLDIGKSGGGILSTVRATREASEKELTRKALNFLGEMTKLGVTTVECKSGYGLAIEEEIKILNVYQKLSKMQPVHIIPTFLGAHIVPPEYENNRGGYIDLIINKMIPAVAERNLAEFCDIFVEDSAFSVEEARRILAAGKQAGFTPKLHADQLTSGGGAELAAEMNAVSADHLEQISDQGIHAMAKADVIGVALPLASLYTQQEPLDCRKLIDGGINVAVATDFNPGSAPSYDLPLAMMLACNRGGITPDEALKGATIYAAKAVRREETLGSIQPGKSADFAILDAANPTEWMYHYRPNCCRKTFIRGEEIS